MSKYTTQVRYICETMYNNGVGSYSDDIESVVNYCWDKIFNNFPLYNESHRKELCTKILKHYYFREIGEEVTGLWKFRLNQVLNEEMPYFNELYKSAEMIINPLNNKDIKRVKDTGGSGNRTVEQNVNTKETQKFSDTPQGALTDIENDSYLTNATINENIGSGNSSENLTQNENIVETISGKDSDDSYGKLLLEYRDTIINIDMMIIKSLSCCFMNIF